MSYTTPFHLQTLQYVSFSFCISDHETVFEAILISYNAALLFVLFLLAFLNTLVHLSVFRREGLQSLQAAVIIFVPIVIATVIQNILKASFQIVYLNVILWMEFTLGVLLPILTSAVLFVPNVRLQLTCHSMMVILFSMIQQLDTYIHDDPLP